MSPAGTNRRKPEPRAGSRDIQTEEGDEPDGTEINPGEQEHLSDYA